jgi:hypothetical protein
LLIEANDTTQTDELRLKLLTVLVDNARLNEVPTPIGVYNIYQPLMGEVFGSVPFANITGLPLDNVAMAAEFDKVLYKSGGTMTVEFGIRHQLALMEKLTLLKAIGHKLSFTEPSIG